MDISDSRNRKKGNRKKSETLVKTLVTLTPKLTGQVKTKKNVCVKPHRRTTKRLGTTLQTRTKNTPIQNSPISESIRKTGDRKKGETLVKTLVTLTPKLTVQVKTKKKVCVKPRSRTLKQLGTTLQTRTIQNSPISKSIRKIKNPKKGGMIIKDFIKLTPPKLTGQVQTMENVGKIGVLKPHTIPKPHIRTTLRLSHTTLPLANETNSQTKKPLTINKPVQNSPISKSIRKMVTFSHPNGPPPPNGPHSISVSFDCDPEKGIQDNLSELCDEQNNYFRKLIIEVITEILEFVFKELFEQPKILRDPIQFLNTLFREIVIKTMIEVLDAEKHSKLIHFLKGVSIKYSRYTNRSLMIMIVSKNVVMAPLSKIGFLPIDKALITEFNTVFSDQKYVVHLKEKIRLKLTIFKEEIRKKFTISNASK